MDAARPTPPGHERHQRRDRRGHHGHQTHQAAHLEAARNPVLHRRSLGITHIARRRKPDRPDQRNQNRAQRSRPPLRMGARSPRQEPRRQQETRHREQRRRPRKARRRTKQQAHEHNQKRAEQRRNHPVRHSVGHRRTADDGNPQVSAQRQRVTWRRVVHPRVRTQRQVADHRHNRRDGPAREGRLHARQDAAGPPPGHGDTDRRPARHVGGRRPSGTGYFSDALAHRPMVTESARGRDAARRPRADSGCDVIARGSRARSAPSAKECDPRARPRPRAPPPSRQPYPTSRTRSRQRAPWSCPRGP